MPILWAAEPTREDWDNVRAAKRETSFRDQLVIPRPAVPGSPGIILCVGIMPDWVCQYAYVPDAKEVPRLTQALEVIFANNGKDPRVGQEEHLLSQWMGAEVKLLRTEDPSVDREDEAALSD